MKKKPIDWKIVVAAIAGLVVIECYAMAHGINGTFRMIVTAAIAGLAGITLPQLKTKQGVRMEEEKKQEGTPEGEETPSEEKPLSIVDEAKKIRDEILTAKNELKTENDRLEKLQSEQLLAGTAGGNVTPEPKKELTDVEYAEAMERGEANPLKDDKLI